MTTSDNATREGSGAQAHSSKSSTKNPDIQLLERVVGSGNVLTLHTFMVDLTGDHVIALFIEQLLYWRSRTTRPNREVAKSDADWHAELRVSDRQMRRIRAWITLRGLVEVRRKRSAFYENQPVYHYTVDMAALEKAVRQALEKSANSASSELGEPLSSEVDDSLSPEVSALASSEPRKPSGSFFTETMSETPAETPAKKKIAAAKTAAAAPRSAPPSIIQSPSEPATLPPTAKPKKQKPEPPAAPDDPKKQRDAALVDLIAAWKDSTGDLNPNAYANKTIRAGAGAMVDAGITVQDVTAYLDGLMYDDWWSSRAVPFSHVVSNIQAWKRENEIYAPVNYEVPKPDLPETDLTWEDLRAMGEELKKTLAERNSLQAVIARADAEYQSPFDRLREDMIARGEL